MARVIEKKMIGFKCEIRACGISISTFPKEPSSLWEDDIREIQQIVAQGWGIVLTSRLRTYCPEHADQVYACTCKTNPRRKHLCTQHSKDAADLVWLDADVPEIVATELSRIGVLV